MLGQMAVAHKNGGSNNNSNMKSVLCKDSQFICFHTISIAPVYSKLGKYATRARFELATFGIGIQCASTAPSSLEILRERLTL